MAEDKESKTEEPTAHRLSEAREKGDVAQSRDLSSFVVFTAFSLGLYFLAGDFLHDLLQLIRSYFDFKTNRIETVPEFLALMKQVVVSVVWLLLPLLSIIMVAGISAYVGQFGWLFTTEKLAPKFEKINPLPGFKRIFSANTVVELVKAVAKVSILGLVFYFILRDEMETIVTIGAQPVTQIFIYLGELIARLFVALVIMLAVFGAADFAYQKWRYFENMKMSKDEVKDEMKQREGDPHMKSRIRQAQRERARKRMMDKVPEADVVVTNPTHVAVALKYDRGKMRAPVVVAKGAGFIALKIKELAMKSQVPILEKRDLARYLYKNVEVGEPIPENLYNAVAEVLAYVLRLKKRFMRSLVRTPA